MAGGMAYAGEQTLAAFMDEWLEFSPFGSQRVPRAEPTRMQEPDLVEVQLAMAEGSVIGHHAPHGHPGFFANGMLAVAGLYLVHAPGGEHAASQEGPRSSGAFDHGPLVGADRPRRRRDADEDRGPGRFPVA